MTDPIRPTVLVLGANGRFGLAAVRAFDAAGWRVLAHVRRDAAADMPERAELVRAPLEATEALLGAIAALPDRTGQRTAAPSIVVHAVNPVYTRWDEELLPAAEAGMAVATRLGARFMLPGNVYNFGADMPAEIAEDTPQRPTTAKGRLRMALERELERRAMSGTLRATVITAGDFFGAGSGSWFDLAIVKSIAKGKLVYPGPMDTVHAWAYLPDLAHAFVASASAPQAERFERYHFRGHALTGRQFMGALQRAARTLGLEPARGWSDGTLPWPLLRVIGLVVPMIRELTRMSYLWRVPHALSGRKLAQRFPQLVTTPIDLALERSLRALGHGQPQGASSPVAQLG